MPAEAIMATANTSALKYQNSAVFDPDSPPSQINQQRNDKDFFESLAAEKPTHLEYLKNFRVYQCPQFLQHKCTQHRPFTCFNWHFQNQRRRQPVQRADKSFNYSPDIYCNQYDETTGTCKKGDDCPFLHRVTGDTERRYHLRYYKTSACIHETDDNRNCEKNGPHCAFGHGHDDLRAPIFDASISGAGEVEIMERLPSTSEDKWNDAEFVLNFYKTESCKKQPRFCRQGYACPHYHNAKDRRRNPKKFKYRSTPCPIVKKVGEDWQDPQKCDKGDSCQMCHTRTEQQFHPDIYKSTKCHDMQQTTYCPRGPFCAFAHVEQHDNDQPGPEGSIRNRAGTADACFKMARERRRAQLEARQNRNSVSGGEPTIRRRAESFTGPSRHFSETYNRTPWSTNSGEQSQRWTNQSPIVMPVNNQFDSPTNNRTEKKEKDISAQFKGLNIRQTQWPPHPDREEVEQQHQPETPNVDPWSPGGAAAASISADIFDDTDGTDFHLPQEETDSKVNFADEIRRRRTQSASHSNYSPYDKAQYSPPLGQAAGDQYRNEWLSPKSTTIRQTQGKSSPISIVQTQSRETQQGSWPKDGSFGSAILRGVGFDSVGNQGGGSGPNSWTDDRNNETAFINKRLQDAQRNNINMKNQFEFAEQQYREQIRDYQNREQEYLRQIEVHNSQSAQLRHESAKERIMLEIRQSVSARTPCTIPREKILTLQRQLRQDLELLERAAAQ